MKKLKNQFLEVSDALALGNPSIPEKDYWVVALLAQLAILDFDTHQMVFSGGTALAKSQVKIFRMSEDVDIKLIPTDIFNSLSRDKRKAKRKALLKEIEDTLTLQSSYFSIEDKLVRDEYRYVEYQLKYPQQFNQAPCLRPIIKLELIETILLLEVEYRSIQSLVAQLYHQTQEVDKFACVTVQSTLVEKVISIIPLFRIVLQEDVRRFGKQHLNFVIDLIQELQLGLSELESNPLYYQRFIDFVTPMVFAAETPNFEICFASFKNIAQSLMINN